MFQEAGNEFDVEMTFTPQEPWSYENRGEICLNMGNTDEAIKFFREALARNPQLPKSLAGLGKAYVLKGEIVSAISFFKDAVAISPKTVSYHYLLGQAYLKAGQRPESEKEMATVKRLHAEVRDKESKNLSGRMPTPGLPVPEP